MENRQLISEEEISTERTAARENQEEGKRKCRELSNSMLKRKSSIGPNEKSKGITCGTAVGAKQGKMKGNKQKAKYQSQERINEKSFKKEWGKRKKRKQKTSTVKVAVRQKQEEKRTEETEAE